MTRQKVLMIGGLLAIVATSLVAPDRWTVDNLIARLATGHPSRTVREMRSDHLHTYA